MGALYQPHDRVFVKPEGEFGNVVQVCGHKKGEWLYEVKLDGKDTYVFADESELCESWNQEVYRYARTPEPKPKSYGSAHVSLGGVPIKPLTGPIEIDLHYGRIVEKKCECGLHSIDPNRMVGHATWCPFGGSS